MKFFIKSKLSENISKTPEGYLLCRNVMLTHTGKLLYMKGEHPFEDISELEVRRTPEELFSKETLSSFEAKSITIQHPQEFVDAKNWQDLTHGVVINVRKGSEQIEVDGEMVEVLLGDFLVTTDEAIKQVENGLREVSLGYDALWVQTGDSTAVHTKVRGNHCALVDSGRAGVQCSIKDEKGDPEMSKLKELQDKFKKHFGKSIDEAMKEKEEEQKSKDASKEEVEKKLAALKAEEAELQEQLKALEESTTDEDDSEKDKSKDEDDDKKKDESKDEETLEERLSRIEAAIAKIVEKLEGKSEDKDEESEEVIADEESEDSDDEEGKEGKAGDVMSRAEILAPGIAASKDVKKKALEAAYKTADGKKAIDSLLGGKTLAQVNDVDVLFIASSELLKSTRGDTFASVRAVSIDSFPSLKDSGAMTPEKINEINAKVYANK